MLKYAMRLKNRYLTLSRHFSSKSIGICAARCKHAICAPDIDTTSDPEPGTFHAHTAILFAESLFEAPHPAALPSR
jgi:hypothetical protein